MKASNHLSQNGKKKALAKARKRKKAENIMKSSSIEKQKHALRAGALTCAKLRFAAAHWRLSAASASKYESEKHRRRRKAKPAAINTMKRNICRNNMANRRKWKLEIEAANEEEMAAKRKLWRQYNVSAKAYQLLWSYQSEKKALAQMVAANNERNGMAKSIWQRKMAAKNQANGKTVSIISMKISA